MGSVSALGGAGVVGALVALVLGLLVAAALLMLSVRIVAGFMPGYARMIAVVLVSAFVTWLVSWLLGMVMGGAAMMGARLVGLAVSILVGAGVLDALVRRADGTSLGYGRAVLVEVLYTVMVVVIFVVLGLLLSTAVVGSMH